MALPTKVLKTGVTDMVRISDARMSGTAFGTVVLHVSPEAAQGGPLAVVRDGDMIELDVPNRRLHLDIPNEELARPRRRVDLADRAAALGLCDAAPRPCRGRRFGRRPRLPQGLPRRAGGPGQPLMQVALVGIGKIALDQHVPAIRASRRVGARRHRLAQRPGLWRARLHRPGRRAGGASRDRRRLAVPAAGAALRLCRGGPARRPPRDAGETARRNPGRGSAARRRWPRSRAGRSMPPGTAGWPPASPPRATGSPRGRSGRRISSGARMCGAGIRGRSGCSSPAAWASSTPASTRCRS